MFIFGGLPALLVSWIRTGVREPAAWQKKAADEKQRPRMRDAFGALFSPEYRHRTMINSLLFTVSIIGLWAGSIYVPAAVTLLVRQWYAVAYAPGWRRTAGSSRLDITDALCALAGGTPGAPPAWHLFVSPALRCIASDTFLPAGGAAIVLRALFCPAFGATFASTPCGCPSSTRDLSGHASLHPSIAGSSVAR